MKRRSGTNCSRERCAESSDQERKGAHCTERRARCHEDVAGEPVRIPYMLRIPAKILISTIIVEGDAMDMPLNQLKRNLQAGRVQCGCWVSLLSHASAEICAGAGFDWVLIDTEHAPNELHMV